jgi:hypothetical protein
VTNVTFEVYATMPITTRIDYGPMSSSWPARCSGLIICPPDISTTTESLYFGSVFGTSTDGINFSFNQPFAPHSTIGGSALYLGDGVYRGTSFRYDFIGFCNLSTTCESRTGGTDSFLIRQVFPAPVPEPATWALMLIGFGAIGWAMRRHARPSAAIELTSDRVPAGATLSANFSA